VGEKRKDLGERGWRREEVINNTDPKMTPNESGIKVK
jgi:hypothetical protein